MRLALLKIMCFGSETFGSYTAGDIVLEGDKIMFSSGICEIENLVETC